MKMLVCTDGSELSMKAARTAAKLAALMEDVEVDIIHVHQPIRISSSIGSVHSSVQIPHSVEKHMKEVELNILERAAKLMRNFGIRFSTNLLVGHPAATIVSYAEKNGFDLLFIGIKGQTALQRVLMGSVSTAVVQQVHCDVYLVK